MKSNIDPRHNARRIALASLFCGLFSEPKNSECFLLSKELLETPEDAVEETLLNSLIDGVDKNRKDIDEVIEDCAPEWPIDKISKVDLIILRIAIYELMFAKDAPDKVVVDEAVELAKEFAGDTSGKFVNGVLGTVVDIKNEVNKKKK